MSVGRPTVITSDIVRKLETAFQDGFSVSEACLTFGISRTAYYERNATDREFMDKMELARTYVSIRAKKTVIHAINEGDLSTAKWWLERKARNEFSLRAVNDEPVQNAEVPEEVDTLKLMVENMKAHGELAIAQVAASRLTSQES
jgi:hypothetical protein